jgi:hypothetical protein
LRRISGTHQLYVEIRKARGLCAPGLVDMLQIVGGANEG